MDVAAGWDLEAFVRAGLRNFELYLERYAAFERYLSEREEERDDDQADKLVRRSLDR